jgi:eukaryotic-like serine/threonine-protein kinase
MPAIPNESKIPVGTTLVGKYRVTREIGRGGMAAVYEAEHMSLGKKIAVKVLASELAASTIVIERFFREARAAASVKSPHIVDVYDSGRLEDGRPFIAMELLEGESLYDRMARVRLIDPRSTVRIIAQCAKGLMKAHAAGVIHRDLKPENIFLVKGEDGEEIAKLLDFGLAKFYAPVQPDEKEKRLTREGAVFGTPAYMSPEQVKGQHSVDHRADLWALGCLAFECLIGRPVWNTDQGVAMTFAAIATAPLPIPSRIRTDLPPAFDEWFKKSLDREPDGRYQSAKELAEALARAFGQSSNVSLPSGHETVPYTTNYNPDDPENQRASNMPQIPIMTANGTPVEVPAPPDAGQARPSALRYAMSSLALAVAMGAAFFVWMKHLRPQVFTPTIMSSASASPSGSAGLPLPVGEEPKWAPLIAEGLALFAQKDIAGAQRKLKEAGEAGAGGAAKGLSAQIDVASKPQGPCVIAALSRPRLGIERNAVRPSIALTAKGPIVTWTDDHEQSGHDHAYSVVIDANGRPLSRPRDLTPEADDVERPQLLASGDRTLLLYWDKSGREAGVRVRWLDADGRIGGPSVLVGAPRPSKTTWPVIDRAPDGFWVAWEDDRDKDGDDLFLRHLSPELDPIGPEIRATDFAPIRSRLPQLRLPSIAVASNAIYVAYKLERDPVHTIERIRIPLTAPELRKGLDDAPSGSSRRDRLIGDVKTMSEDKISSDAPSIACGTEGCFLAWHAEAGQGGAYAALIDPVKGNLMWHKRLAPNGGRPSLAVSDGQVAVAYYEQGRMRMRILTRDVPDSSGISILAKVSGDQPRPSLAGGKQKGEWLVAWQDNEERHVEAYAARISCK